MKGILTGKISFEIRRSSLTTQMARAIWGVARFAGARLYCLVYFDVAVAGGSSQCTMAAEELIPNAMLAVALLVRWQR